MSSQVLQQLVEEEEGNQQGEVEAEGTHQAEPTWGDLSAVAIFDILVKVQSLLNRPCCFVLWFNLVCY